MSRALVDEPVHVVVANLDQDRLVPATEDIDGDRLHAEDARRPECETNRVGVDLPGIVIEPTAAAGAEIALSVQRARTVPSRSGAGRSRENRPGPKSSLTQANASSASRTSWTLLDPRPVASLSTSGYWASRQ